VLPRRNESGVAYVESRKQQTHASLKKAAERLVRLQRRAWSRAANETRNAKLSPERRSEIARKAARARHRYRRATPAPKAPTLGVPGLAPSLAVLIV
jgi:hypothetical protein